MTLEYFVLWSVLQVNSLKERHWFNKPGMCATQKNRPRIPSRLPTYCSWTVWPRTCLFLLLFSALSAFLTITSSMVLGRAHLSL